MRSSLLLLIGWLCSSTPSVVTAILPTAEIQVNGGGGDSSSSYVLLASQASFGPLSPMKKKTEEASPLMLPPSSNPLLCDTVTTSNNAKKKYSNVVLVVPRGECTYNLKAYHAQQLGASGVILYNTLASRYSINTTAHATEKYPTYSTSDILFPQEYYDYDCAKGSANIPSVDVSFQPLPYNADQNDPLLSGATDDNLCQLYAQDDLRQCDSKRCLITELSNTTTTKVCCAWDLHLWLYLDTTLNQTVTIPTVFVTMQQADRLLQDMMTTQSQVTAVIRSRWRPEYNISSMLIWMLGVTVAAFAAYGSASDYHTGIRKLLRQRQPGRTAVVPTGQAAPPLATRNPMQEETLELEPIHALGFVVMASSSLFILFYFEIYNVVKVMYALGCSNAVVQVLVQPLVVKLGRYLGQKPRLVYRSDEFGDISNWDVLAGIIGYLWGMTWLYMALMVRHSDGYAFFWITQDLLGACMCIVFLGLIQLNSIQVASLLLMVAFVYDIFFVFVTPYIFNESIMITVATSGGPPKADPLWCEKYPNDANCQGGDPLPMLLTVPRLLDYQGGSSLLGLGDIVLPGLLLSFAARLDAAKSLVAITSGGRQPTGNDCEPQRCCAGIRNQYFVPLVIAYAIGLLMANVAVYVMNMGQPALLYLVPCTLGTMCYLGYQRHELKQLWEGPRVLHTADQLVYGTRPQAPPPIATTSSTPEALEEFVDDEAGDVPLLSTTPTNTTTTATTTTTD